MTSPVPSRIKPAVAAGFQRTHPLADRLAGAWLLHEGTGQVAHDGSGRRHDGSFAGALWRPSVFGPAVEFDGVDDRISMGNCLNLGTGDVTVFVLVQHSAVQPESWQGQHLGAIVGKGYLGGGGGYGLFVSNGEIRWQVVYQSTAVQIASDTLLNDGRWHAVAAVCDRDHPAGLQLYIDGVRQAATADPTGIATANITNAGAFAVGSRQGDNLAWVWDFLGRVAVVYVWQRVLTEAEIRLLHREPFALFARRRAGRVSVVPGGSLIDLAGCAEGVSSASAALHVIGGLAGVAAARVTAVGTLRRTSPARVRDQRPWRREVLFHGGTSTAFQLGTMLTQGWFWTHPGGCAAVYCGASPARMDLDRIVHVADVPAGTFTLPAHLSPPAGSTRCYLVRRFDSCGRPEQTIAAVVAVRIDSEGQLAPPAPNGVFGLAVEQTDGGRLRLTWLYEPLDQQAVPQEFCLYWDSGSGAVDREHPLATIAGRGRGCYRYETGPLAEGRYTFLLLARSAESAENPSAAALICRMTARVPEAPTILQGAAV